MTELAKHPAIRSVVNATFEQRMTTLDALNSSAGYVAPKTILPPGTALWEVGTEKLGKLRADVARLPTLAAFAVAFERSEALAAKIDVKDSLGKLRMTPTGQLYRLKPDGTGGGTVGYTMTGLSQVVSFMSEPLGLPSGMAKSLAFLSPKARAEGFNDLATRYDAVNRDHTQHVYRTALNVHGERYLRAVTSTKHVGAVGGYLAITKALATLWPEAKARVVHTEDRFDLDLIFPMMNREIRVGDVLHGTLSITLSETKDTSARVSDSLLRVLCANLTTANYGKESFIRRHVGPRTFARELAERTRDGWNRLAPFVEAFGDSYADPLPAFAPTRAEVVARVEKANALPAESLRPVLGAWDLDGARSAGDTRGGLVNALTRHSQTLDVEAAETVEKIAGGIVADGWSALS